MLSQAGPDLPPGLLLKTEVPYISKVKVQGNPKLRPMVCRGPLKVVRATGEEEDEKGFTILIGAKEISNEFVPPNADVEAGARRVEVIENPEKRRCTHERIN